MFPSSPKSPIEVPTRGGASALGVGWGSGAGRGVSARLDLLSGLLGRPVPAPQRRPASPGPAIPGKKGELHYPAGLPPPSFLSCLHVAGGEGGAWTSPSYILFPCVRAGIIFFFFFLPLLPPPARPSFPPSLPSLPPLSAGFVRWGAGGTPPPPGRAELGTGDRLSRASSLPSLSLPPSPTPPPHPRLGLGAAA